MFSVRSRLLTLTLLLMAPPAIAATGEDAFVVVTGGSDEALGRYPRGMQVDPKKVCLEKNEVLVAANRNGLLRTYRGPGCNRLAVLAQTKKNQPATTAGAVR